MRSLIGNFKTAGDVVIGVEASSGRPRTGGAQRPMLGEPGIDSESGAQRLRNGKLGAFHAPGAQVFRNRRYGESRPEFSFKSRVRGGAVVFVHRRPEEQIAGVVAGEQSCPAPWPSDPKIDGAGEIPRVQVLFREGTCFADHVSREGQP